MMAVKYQIQGNPFLEIPRIIKEEDLSNHYYSTVNIYSKCSKFIFVPNAEYSYGTESVFIQNSFPINNEEINVELCSQERLNIIHAYPQEYQEAFADLKTENNFRHLSLAFIEGIKSDGVYVSISSQSITILVREGGKFLFYNQFDTSTIEDCLYFIMLTYDQLGLNPEQHKLILDGVEARKSELKDLLSNYIVHISASSECFTNMDFPEDLMDLYLASICE